MSGMRGPAAKVSPDEDAAMEAAGAALMAVVVPIAARRLPMDGREAIDEMDFAASAICGAMQSVLATKEAAALTEEPEILAYLLGTLMVTCVRGHFTLGGVADRFVAGIYEAVSAMQDPLEPQGGGTH